jgi:hypothetical protein
VPPFQPLDVVLGDANGSATLPRAFSTTKQGLLMMSRFFPPTLSYFDPTTTDTTTLGVMSQRMHGCALGSDGTLYATGRDTVTNVGTLYSFDPLSGSATTIGQTIDATNATQYFISSMVFVGPTLYGFVDGPCCSSPIKRLVTLDLATGSATLVGASAVTAVTTRGPVVGFRDDTSVWYAETTAGTLDTLALTNSARSTWQPLSGGNGASVRSLVTLGGTLYLLEDGNPATLYSVDSSGGLTQVASLVSGAVSLCKTPPTF